MRLFIVAWLAGVIVLQREPSLPDVAWGPAGIAALLALHFVRSRVARALVVLAAAELWGQTPSDLSKMSFDDLMNVEVTSVARRGQKL